MRYLKSHISTIISITILLIGFQTYTFMNQMIKAYKNKLLSDYSIVLVSKDKLTIKSFTQKYIKSIKPIDINSSIKDLKDSISEKNFKQLSSKIPNFYSITLKKLPNKNRLNEIKSELEEYKFVTRVEVFNKTYEKLYSFFLLNNYLITLLVYTGTILSILLLIKEIEIWRATYSQRLYIMSLFGGGEFIKNAEIFKNYIIDAIISVLFASIFFLYLTNSDIIRLSLKDLNADKISFGVSDFGNLFFIAITVALCVLFFVTIKNKK